MADIRVVVTKRNETTTYLLDEFELDVKAGDSGKTRIELDGTVRNVETKSHD